MQFTIEQKPRFAHITGTGRLNMVGAPKLREVVAKVVGEGSNHVVVDLGGTEFMDSSGLGALIGCLKLARQAGGPRHAALPSAGELAEMIRSGQVLANL